MNMRLQGLAVLCAAVAGVAALRPLPIQAGQQLYGFNVIVAPGHPFGSAAALQALTAARRLGANTVSIVPFLWQKSPSDVRLVRGTDMPDDELRTAIREAHTLGFSVMVKPQIWVPTSWAGAVEPTSEADWQDWFQRYQREIIHIARIAAAENADIFVIGTELTKTSQRLEWGPLIAAIRGVFPRKLTYVAHNLDEAETVPFWPQLDAIGVSLYPPLGADDDRAGRLATMRAIADRLDALADRFKKPVYVAEIGLRSAVDAAAKPWESAEERTADPDPMLQADVLGDWVSVLRRPAIGSVLVWRWFTDPAAGGPSDTDFTVQGKPAEAVLRCAWKVECRHE